MQRTAPAEGDPDQETDKVEETGWIDEEAGQTREGLGEEKEEDQGVMIE